MKYRYAIFDFDLTLADSSVGIIECYKHTLALFDYPIPTDKEIYDTIGKTLEDSFDILTGIKDNPQNAELRAAYVKKANTVMASKTVFYDDAIALLQILQNAGVKTAIVSSKMRYRIEETFMLHTGAVPVDVIVGLSDAPVPKPDPSGLIYACELLGAPREDTIYIGDNTIDAVTAKAAGIDFGAVTTGSTTAEEFSAYPNVAVAGSLLELFQELNKS